MNKDIHLLTRLLNTHDRVWEMKIRFTLVQRIEICRRLRMAMCKTLNEKETK